MRLCEAVAAACAAALLLVLVMGCDDIEDPQPRCPSPVMTLEGPR